MNNNVSDLMNKFSDMIENSTLSGDNVNSSSGFSPEMISSLASMLNTSSGNDKNSNIDINTITNIKNIMDKVNISKNSADTNLLTSLKPYLKESRKSKVDQYINILAMSKAMNLFSNSGGDK